MKKAWRPRAREDYERWRRIDPKVWKLVNALVRDVERSPYEGLGRPRELQFEWKGWWVREIPGGHRFIYRVREKDAVLEIARCRDHYR